MKDDRIENRRAAMDLARRQAMDGDPICGAFFAFLHGIKKDPNASFLDEFYEEGFEDNDDEIRPY